MKKYGIGVIGLGMGKSLLEINKFPDSKLEVRSICAPRINKVQAIKEEYGIKEGVTDYMKVIENKDVDIVAVFSPDHLHAEHCIAALKAKKHVICTKPMVTTLDDAREVVSLVKKHNLKFLTGQTMRYEPQFANIKRMYDDGELGEIVLAEAHYVHDMRPVYKMTPWRIEVPQDVMYGGVSHPVDVLRWFLGDVEEVFAYGAKGIDDRYKLEANFILNLKFKSGVIARVLGAYGIVHPPMPMMGVTIYGSKASALGSFSDQLGGETQIIYDKFELKEAAITKFPPEIEGAYGHGETVIRYLNHFESCLENDFEPVPNATEGAKTVAVCSAAWESVKTGKPVKVFNEF
jgi:predicted dehydrogenase